MDDINSFGEWVKRRRQVLGLTQDDLARRVGCAKATIRKIEADERRPSVQIAERLADVLALAAHDRAAFLQSARAEVAADRLPQPAQLPSAFPSGIVTFLLTDIEGSTMHWEQQPQAMERALERHDAIMRQTIDAYGGHVFKTVGDAFYAVFTTAADALDAVLAAQRALAAQSWGPIGAIQVRAALHVGAAQHRDGDYFGPPLNRVARLCAAGHGGQVLLSNAAQELVRDQLPKGTSLRDLGEHRLKDLARPERVFQAVAPDLGGDFPALRTLDSYRHNLPPQPTPLIGREAEVALVCDLLRRHDVHLLTLTGPGGIGKTRLALQAAAELLDEFRDGVSFVPLAHIRDPQLVIATIAQALDVNDSSVRPLIELLKAYLREKQALLVLDNFEQVAAAAPSIAEVLAAASGLKTIVTSREALHLYGEHEYGVPPLSLPDLRRLPPIERLTQYEAVRLFIERAQAVRPDFAVTAENAPALAEVCARLDGLPLAIELAAARSKLFPPKALLSRLDKRLQFLTGGARDLPVRQQTLRDAIAWSYDLLDVREQAIFARLGVFAGGCTVEAAEAVLGDADTSDEQRAVYISPDSVLDGLSSLVDKSLLKQTEGADGEPRFVMIETIGEYALERLEMSGEAETIRQAHASFYLALAVEAEPKLRGAQQAVWMGRFMAEHHNMYAALAWLKDGDEMNVEAALRLAGTLYIFPPWRGYWNEGREWLARLAAFPGAPSRTAAWAKALYAAGSQALFENDGRRARAYIGQALAMYRELGDREGCLSAATNLEELAISHPEYDWADGLHEENLGWFQELGDKEGIATALSGMGFVAQSQGDCTRAQVLFEEALAQRRELGNKVGIATTLTGLGRVAHSRGDYNREQKLLEEALALNRELGNRHDISWSLRHLGEVMRIRRDYARAAALFEECLTLVRELRDTYCTGDSLRRMARLAYDQGDDKRATLLGEESVTLLRQMGSKSVLAAALTVLGRVALSHGATERAGELFKEGLSLLREWSNKQYVIEALAALAEVMTAEGHPERSARLLGAMEALCEASGTLMTPGEQYEHDRGVAAARTQLDEVTFAEAWAQGRAMTLEQAIAEALRESEPADK